MCVTHGHMHANGEVYKRGGKLVHRGGEEQKYKEGKKNREKKRERKRSKGERKKGKRKSTFRWSEVIGPRSKIRIFDEGYTLRGRDSSYFGLFSTIRVVGLLSHPTFIGCDRR